MGLLSRGFFIVFFLLIPFRVFGVEDFEKLCNEEVLKNEINETIIQDYCIKASEKAIEKKEFGSALWYQLLAGNYNENINKIQLEINNNFLENKNLLKDDFNKTKIRYQIFLQNSSIPLADEAIQANFMLLNLFYPKEKDNLKKILKIWDDIYLPLKPVNNFYKKYKETRKNKKYKEAIHYLKKIIELQKKHQNNNGLNILDKLNKLVAMYYYLGNYKKALEYSKKSLIIKEKVFGKSHIDTSISYNNIGMLYKRMNRYKETLIYLKKSLVIKEKILGKEHIDTSLSYNNIGSLYQNMHHYEKALKYFKKSLIIKEKVLGKEHIKTSLVYNNIGILYKEMNSYLKALEYLKKSLIIKEKFLGKEHRVLAVSYNNIGFVYKKMDKYKKALISFEQSLVIAKKTLGEEHTLTASTYDNIGLLYLEISNYKKALKYLKQALVIRETIFGNKHIDTAESYNNIGSLYEKMDNYKKTLEYFKKSLAIKDELLGKEHKDISINYNNIGLLYLKMGNYKKALEYVKKSLKINKKYFKEESIEIARDYNNLASIYADMNHFKEALEYFKKSLTIHKKILGEEHTKTSTVYSNIGMFFKDINNYKKALEYLKKSLAIREKVLGAKHIETASSYNNIGMLYQDMNHYKEALEYLKKSLKIHEKILGTEHTITAASYINVGAIYSNMKNYKKAFEYLNKSLVIYKKVLGKEHKIIPVAKAYNNIGTLYYEIKNDEEALKNFKKSLSINEKIFGKEHTETARNYNQIGVIYGNKNNYKLALEYIKKSLLIREKKFGNKHIDTAHSYNNLGTLYRDMGDYEKALKYQNKALTIFENILKENHHLIAVSHSNISATYYSTEKYSQAYIHSKKAFHIFMKNRDKVFALLDSTEKEKYLKSYIKRIDFLLDSATKHLIELQKKSNQIKTIKVKKESIDNWLNYKGTIFEYQNILPLVEQKTKDPILKKEIREYQSLNQKLANLEQKQTTDNNPKKFQEEITKIQNRISNLEVSLGENNTSRKIRELFGLKNINVTTIVSELKVNQLYIDFAKTDKNYYIFTLNKNNKINFIQIDEEDSQKLDENIKGLESNNKKMVEAIEHKTIEQKKEQLKKESQIILSELYNTLVVKYLSKELKNKKSLIISPDGLLNFLPFEALYHEGRYLIEDYQISYISSGREFVRQTKREKAEPKYEMICFGNPDFNLPSNGTKGMPIQNKGKVPELWKNYKNFSYLGDTEIKMIRELYKKNILIYEKENATVRNLMKVESSKILHLSTHGKFLNNENIKNPMLKSGLAFTGANNKNNFDGIVTALKISALDLKETELVVLSACESGLGDVQNAEGVVGLPKAFLQAGARNVIMTLWSVSTKESSELMKYFYQNIKSGQEYAIALRNAKIKMIEMHPYYWSAFILHGIQN